MKIIHTSDWHIGARLHERDRSAEHKAFFSFLRELAEKEKPDALIVAGDIFDIRQPSNAAERLYYDFLAETASSRSAGRIIITAGNHDSAEKLAAADKVLKRLGVEVVAKIAEDISREIITLKNAAGETALVIGAVPFLNDGDLLNSFKASGEEADSIQKKLSIGFDFHYRKVIEAAKRVAKGAPIVLTAHAAFAGARSSDAKSERARQVGSLDLKRIDIFEGVDYAALGHLHTPQRVSPEFNAYYSGSPLQMSFAEAGQRKSVKIVEFPERSGGEVAVRDVEFSPPVKLVKIEGDMGEILSEIERLSRAPGGRIYAALKVASGAGDIASFINEARNIASGTRVEILPVEDSRSRPGSAPWLGGKEFDESATLENFSPVDVARMRLEEEHLDKEELEKYLAMVKALAEEAE